MVPSKTSAAPDETTAWEPRLSMYAHTLKKGNIRVSIWSFNLDVEVPELGNHCKHAQWEGTVVDISSYGNPPAPRLLSPALPGGHPGGSSKCTVHK